MFYCELGKHTTKPGEKLVRVVTKTRSVTYREGSVGQEIEHETPACSEHAPKEQPVLKS